MQSFLVIQTAFIGDVILATAVVEKLHQRFPNASIDFLCRKGNEALLAGHPIIRETLVWNKSEGKYRNLLRLRRTIQRAGYSGVFNLQRYAASGFLTASSAAKVRAGFRENPFAFRYTHKVRHGLQLPGSGEHEIDRNHRLIAPWAGSEPALPRLYPTDVDRASVAQYTNAPFITLSPHSVWFTKRWPEEHWRGLAEQLESTTYLLGGPGEQEALEEIARGLSHVEVLAGRTTLLESAALMAQAQVNVVNDSGPLHLASATNAPTVAIFCSTVPTMGFGPLSQRSKVVEPQEKLDCRPCGLHGFKECPQGHFNCGKQISPEQVLRAMQDVMSA